MSAVAERQAVVEHVGDRAPGYAAYKKDGCRCSDCHSAVRAYERNRYRQLAYGRWTPLVDAEPVRMHVQALMQAGVGYRRIAAESGVSTSTIDMLLYGGGRPAQTQRVRPETARALLAVSAQIGRRTDATGPRRRFEALVANGWSPAELSRRIGMGQQSLLRMMVRPQIEVVAARKIRALFDELAFVEPPSRTSRQRGVATKARRRATEGGWLPPAAWFDVDIDDPAAVPDTDALRQRTASGRERRSPEALVEDVEWLLRTGESLAQALVRLGMSREALEVALRRAERTDLWRSLTGREELTRATA
jgi:hypothetical protein